MKVFIFKELNFDLTGVVPVLVKCNSSCSTTDHICSNYDESDESDVNDENGNGNGESVCDGTIHIVNLEGRSNQLMI